MREHAFNRTFCVLPRGRNTMPKPRLTRVLVLILLLTAGLAAQQPARRPLKLDDLARIRDVRDPQISPDGQWVAYVVSTTDVKEDKSSAHIWLASLDSKVDRQITFSMESEG